MSQRIDAGPRPPGPLVTVSVNLAMMQPAYRDGELVTDLKPNRARLRKAQVVRVTRTSAADKTRLVRHEPAVLFVPQSGRFLRRRTASVGGLLDRHGIGFKGGR